MFRSQQIIIREYVCTSLKLLNYLKKAPNLCIGWCLSFSEYNFDIRFCLLMCENTLFVNKCFKKCILILRLRSTLLLCRGSGNIRVC